MASQKEEDVLIEDAKEILHDKPYHWNDWNIFSNEYGLYLWNDVTALKLLFRGEGWFYFYVNGKFSCMLSHGVSVNLSDENKKSFLQQLQKVENFVKAALPSQPILSTSEATHLEFGNWLLICKTDGEIQIHNSIIQKQAVVLKEDLPGFMFQSKEEKICKFITETSVCPELADGWAKKEKTCLNTKSKLESLRQKKNITKPKAGKCSYCKTTLNDDILQFHEEECLQRPTICPDCSATMPLKEADNHFCKPDKGSNKLLEMDLLSKHLMDLFTNENCWDTLLQVGNKEFKAHRAILTARSSVFLAMFQHDTSEKRTGTVNIADCDPDSFKEFLDYLYCGKLENISSDSALHLYIISDKYNVQELQSFCLKYLIQNITTENVCEVVILADKYDETELLSAIQDFFNRNFNDIVITTEWETLMNKNFRLANKLLIEKSKAEKYC